MPSSYLSNTTLSFTNTDGQGTISYSNSGDIEINTPVIAQSITASALVVGENAAVVTTSVFGEISVSALKDVGAIEMDGSTSGTLTLQPAATTASHTLTLPAAQGSADTFLKNNGSGGLTWAAVAGGSGDVAGPASATDNAVARFDATTGKLLQNSTVTISDTSDIAGAKTIALNGSSSGTLTVQPAASTTSHTLTLPSAQGAVGTVLRNNGSGGLSWSLTMQPVFYWSRPANGDPRSSQTYNGAFAGDATITGVAIYDGVRLTSANNNLTGSVNWNVTGFDFSRDFALRVYFYQNNSADGIFIGFGGSSAILNLNTANNAVVFAYNTYGNNLNTQFYKNGVAQGTALTFRSGVTYTGAWMTTTIEHRTYGAKKILTVYHGSNSVMENAIESTAFTFGGSYLAVGGRTGAANGTHHVNGVTLEYL